MLYRENNRYQKGAALLEVLVSAIILGVSMLGILSMQNMSVGYKHQASLNGHMIFLIEDIVDKMRNNEVGVDGDRYITGLGATAENMKKTTDCETTPCNITQLASWDLQQWKVEVARLLPQGQASIARVDADTFTITVQYVDHRIDGDPAVDGVQPSTESYSIRVQP